MRHRTAGALVISLDFELHWGVRDKRPATGGYRTNLLGARAAIPQILDLFEEFDIAGTWATVGFLFAQSRSEFDEFRPAIRPHYTDPVLDAYREQIGVSEADDPLHYAPSLVRLISSRHNQEIATHTYSHYYCLEPGQTRQAFRADLKSAVHIASQQGISLKSIVFPRNQVNLAYCDLLAEVGITCYRGTESTWLHRARSRSEENLTVRGPRLLDHYLPLTGDKTVPWADIIDATGLANVRASTFLRPYSPGLGAVDGMRLLRITKALHTAAEEGSIFHIWWHPHNFGVHTAENLQFLRRLLEAFARLQKSHGMQSLSMAQVAAQAKQYRSGGIEHQFQYVQGQI